MAHRHRQANGSQVLQSSAPLGHITFKKQQEIALTLQKLIQRSGAVLPAGGCAAMPIRNLQDEDGRKEHCVWH